MPLLKLMKSGRPVLGERSGNSDNKKNLPKGAKLVALPVEKVLSEPIDLTCAPCEDPSIGHVRIEDDEALLVAGLSEYGFEQDTHILQLGVGNEAYYQGLTHEPA